MKLVVNIPAFNEADKIGETIKKIPKSISGIDEIFIQVIDDGSKDKTAEIARAAGADFVYSHKVNRGIGKTFRTAAEKALRNGADIMVNIDADGQFDPKDIPKIIQPVIEGDVDMVSADRFSEKTAKDIPWVKSFLNRVAAWIIGEFMGTKIHDLTCGFRAYSQELLLRLNLPGEFTYTQEVIIDTLGKNMKIQWVPVEVRYFPERKSRVVRSVYRYVNSSFKIILKAIRDVRPMKFFGIPGFILILASFVFFIIFFFLYIQALQVTTYRNYLLLAVILFLVGLQLLVFALVADMIKSSRRLSEDLMYQIKKEKYRKD